jgi:hypothetical protein
MLGNSLGRERAEGPLTRRMSAQACREHQPIEQPAIGLFADRARHVAGPTPTAGLAGEPCDAGLPDRECRAEVVLVRRLHEASAGVGTLGRAWCGSSAWDRPRHRARRRHRSWPVGIRRVES